MVALLDSQGLSAAEMAPGFASFKGIKRRQEILGSPGGVTVVDDFAHHPTAVRVTLDALRLRFGGRRLWAIFEPRSNTTRRKIFQTELAESFADADGVVVSQIARLELLAPEERLNPEQLLADLKTLGKDAAYLPDAEAIVAYLATKLQGGDMVCVFSNGGFGGIHGKLLERLGRR